MNKIKLCPWCGSDDVGVSYGGYWTVECGNCGHVGGTAETSDEAVGKWNSESQRDWELLRQQREIMAG